MTIPGGRPGEMGAACQLAKAGCERVGMGGGAIPGTIVISCAITPLVASVASAATVTRRTIVGGWTKLRQRKEPLPWWEIGATARRAASELSCARVSATDACTGALKKHAYNLLPHRCTGV